MLLIKNALLFDPSVKSEATLGSILINNGQIVEPESKLPSDIKTIDAQGSWVVPGLIDLNSNLYDPGFADREIISSGAKSASKGGFTSICVSPKTNPAVDNVTVLEYVKAKSKEQLYATVYQQAAITKNLEGNELTEINSLREAGAIAFSNGQFSFNNLSLLKTALQYTSLLNVPIISQAQDKQLFDNGVVNLGEYSLKLGLKGIPAEAETVAIARELEILRMVPKAHIHFSGISCARSVELIRRAKDDGLNVTADVAAHSLMLLDENLNEYDTNKKVLPPLRKNEDREALINGLCDGTIDSLSSMHNPQTDKSKKLLFADASFGITSFETALAIYLETFIHSRILSPQKLINCLTVKAAKCLNLQTLPSLKAGSNADLTIINPNEEWIYTQEQTVSKSLNNPFYGRKFKGRAIYTIKNGQEILH
jgi:dihydroorotase